MSKVVDFPNRSRRLRTARARLCRAGLDLQFLLPAWRLASRGAGGCRRVAGSQGARPVRSQLLCRRGACLCGAARHRDSPPADFRYLVGARLCFADGTPDIIAYPTDRDGLWAALQAAERRQPARRKGRAGAHFRRSLRLGHSAGVAHGRRKIMPRASSSSSLPMRPTGALTETMLARLGGTCAGSGLGRRAAAALTGKIARGSTGSTIWPSGTGAPLLATNDVLYHEPDRRMVQDVVTCIREHLTLEERRLAARRQCRAPYQDARRDGAAVPRTSRCHCRNQRFADRIGFSLDQLKYNYPEETIGNGETAQQTLERLTWEGAARRYPKVFRTSVKRSLWSELCLIAYKGYAAYFLTVQRHRHVCPLRAQDPLPGPRVGGQFGGLLLPRDHRGQSRKWPPGLWPLHLAPSATSRPISTSISSMSGARR